MRLGIKHITTTTFHPCSTGMVERAHRQLKDALRARQAANDWPEHLPWVLLGLLAAPKEDSCVSSSEMVLAAGGHGSRAPIFLLTPIFRDFLAWRARTVQEEVHPQKLASRLWPVTQGLQEEETTFSEENTSEVREEPATCRAKTVRRCITGLVFYFCLRQCFVDVYILSGLLFCGRLSFVNANI
jgi:hypothetical protein